MKIASVVNGRIDVEPIRTKKPVLIEIQELLSPDSFKTEPKNFENRVLNCFFRSMDELGISKVYQMKNSRADGLLLLDNGETVLLEFKHALGWAECCQARIQFQWFLIEETYKELSVREPEHALIVFHHFGRDWAKKSPSGYPNGWRNFYDEENRLSKRLIKTNIAQLPDDGNLVFHPEDIVK